MKMIFEKPKMFRTLAELVKDVPDDELKIYVDEYNRRARELHSKRMAERERKNGYHD